MIHRPNPIPPRHTVAGGFTLLELLITIVVVGILAGIAYPSFMSSIRKGRRSEAFTALAAVQQAQERWRGNNSTYTTTLSDLGISSTTASGYYGITLAAPPGPATTATGYQVIAAAQSGTSQTADGACSKLGVQILGGNITYGGCDGCSTMSFAATHACWSR